MSDEPTPTAECYRDLLRECDALRHERDLLRQQLVEVMQRNADVVESLAIYREERDGILERRIADLMQRNADLVSARDACAEQVRRLLARGEAHAAHPVFWCGPDGVLRELHDATDPGAALVAETRAALRQQAPIPANALRGGDGIQR